MGLSKSTRILILLAIDTAFFLLELIVGYAVHSLALVSDSFHMLNDVLSLCVGLWAVRVAHENTNSKMYTYGWQRAETLGALINGVFLVALCLSIFLEAIQRFVEPQEVSNPRLVLIVGCFGFASNIIGLFFFHEHGHSHGGGHSHGQTSEDGISVVEEGHGHTSIPTHVPERTEVAIETGKSDSTLSGRATNIWNNTIRDSGKSKTTRSSSWEARYSSSSGPSLTHVHTLQAKGHSRSRSRGYSTLEDIYVHPASFRNEIIAAARSGDDSATDTETEQVPDDEVTKSSEQSPLLGVERSRKLGISSRSYRAPAYNPPDNGHKGHKDKNSKSHGKKAHSHGDLNMRGVFLHVMGDALGNLGVIASALIIWLTNYEWRFYFDPLISLIITIIILCSAIPLCKAASRILLQAVPVGISVDDIKADIVELPGILSCHHLHVWQLSSSKLVASLHVEVDFDFKEEGSARYMYLARAIRRCLHEYGIHSSTIQPEFRLDTTYEHHVGSESSCDEEEVASDDANRPLPSKQASRTASLHERVGACLLECGEECDNGQQCCAPGNMDCRPGEDGNIK